MTLAPAKKVSRAARRTPRFRGSRILIGAVPLLVVIALWQVAKAAGALPFSTVPSPSDVAVAGYRLIADGELVAAVAHTLVAVILGWVVGSAAGLMLGIALGASATTWRWTMATVQVLRAIPAIAFVSIAVIVFSQTLTMEVVIAAWVAVWPVAISAMDGIRDVTPHHRELAHSLRMRPLARLIKIELPTAAPNVFVALRLSLGGSLALAIVAEIVGNPQGIGYALVQQQLALHADAMFAYIIVAGLIGLALNAAIQALAPLVPGTRGGRS